MIDINECVSNPCENGGACNDELNAYTCTCIAGYTGPECQQGEIISECLDMPTGTFTHDLSQRLHACTGNRSTLTHRFTVTASPASVIGPSTIGIQKSCKLVFCWDESYTIAEHRWPEAKVPGPIPGGDGQFSSDFPFSIPSTYESFIW